MFHSWLNLQSKVREGVDHIEIISGSALFHSTFHSVCMKRSIELNSLFFLCGNQNSPNPILHHCYFVCLFSPHFRSVGCIVKCIYFRR